MIGRYGDLSVYKTVFKSSDFYRIVAAGSLIPVGYLLSRIDFSMGIGPGLALTGPVLFNLLLILSIALNGFPIILEALKGLMRRKVNVDELVSIAIVACILNGNFLEAAVISFIMVLGSFIEEAVSDRARGAIETLINANPRTATIEEENGRMQVKPVDTIQPGEIAVVKAGAVIPVDGRIVDGSGSIDESLLTGESLPVYKGPGNDLSAGTLNIDGYIKLAVSRTGEDSTIGRIIELVQNAENSRIQSTRIVDRFAAYFTPTILLIAALTWLATRDITRAIAVLVVGCPCSFLLAGPVATVAAVGRAARSGILIKGGEYLEKLARSRTFFFDKTGTLTAGRPSITAIRPAEGFTEAALMEAAAAVERGSTHPIAVAILKKAAIMGIIEKTADELTVIPGVGVKGLVDGKTVSVRAGSADPDDAETVVQVVVNGRPAGEIALLDKARPDVSPALAQLKALGVAHMAVLSGDTPGAVKQVANDIGIAETHCRLKPEDKMAFIRRTDLPDTVFVGDGMNDAPSLKASAVGIAMGQRGSEMALSTADIVLMKDRISQLPFLVRLSRKMTRTINANIAVSLAINLVAICLGAMGLLPPIMGAVAHNMGSILVVLLSSAIAFTREDAVDPAQPCPMNACQHGA
ncbi:heavy metal translocating P-type ATPase [uncultured Desulfosarcina sp.]|uniref:heavy metal translocating P-type ATPase n=1 Tax=uncultured Desulfosarcina sp. TaxID=218289 RepID=UPI0029C8F4D7|nr:heavy metal translocating P-type ATPase [uncultured Desulfosarcina sp.]